MNNILERHCPICDKIISYKSKYNKIIADKNNSYCKSCNNKGSKNPRYGIKMSEKSKELLRKNHCSLKQEYRDNMSKIMTGNTNGHNVNAKIIAKLGLVEGNKKICEMNHKKSLASKGKNNPMFGKPSPQGSGNGWKGWYKNIFFRSLRELSCMIYFEKNKIKWESAEKIKIEYADYLGQTRNYHPDFLLKNKIIECKPKRLWKTPLIMAKTKAAVKYVKKIGLVYKLFDPNILSIKIINKLVDKEKIKFTDRYQQKYLSLISK